MISLTAVRRTLIALPATLLSCTVMTAARGQMPPISGGNISVMQYAKTNDATDVAVIKDSRVNLFEVTSRSNRGDYSIYSSVDRMIVAQTGIYMAAVRQNGRDNSVAPKVGGNSAGPVSGKAYATCGLEFGTNNVSIPVFHAQTGGEFNVDVAALYFPYRTVTDEPGWIGCWARNAFDNGPITAADSFFCPGITLGTQFLDIGGGSFTTTTAGVAAGQVLLTVPGVAEPNDAVLIVTAEGGDLLNAGNIVNYEWSSALSGYVVESRHLTDDNTNEPALESVGPEPMFSFALVLSSRGIPAPAKKPRKPPQAGSPAPSRQKPATRTSSPTSHLIIRRTRCCWKAAFAPAGRAGGRSRGNGRKRKMSGMPLPKA